MFASFSVRSVWARNADFARSAACTTLSSPASIALQYKNKPLQTAISQQHESIFNIFKMENVNRADAYAHMDVHKLPAKILQSISNNDVTDPDRIKLLQR